jgi:glycosyltransferase involved in cell wall biosynthesis
VYQRLGISWQLSDFSGWGVFGWNLVQELARLGEPVPLLLTPPNIKVLTALERRFLEPLIKEQASIEAAAAENPGQLAVVADAVVLHHLGNNLALSEISSSVQGQGNVGVVFMENPLIDKEAFARASKFDSVIAGSTWNGSVLRNAGLGNVQVVLQGIDPTHFRPAPESKRLFTDRFVIFSGGKLEYRKGQDIVLAAFKIFRQRRPDALLVTLWHNPWASSSQSLRLSGHVDGPPAIDDDGALRIGDWATAHGIPPAAFIDLGQIPNSHLAPILHQMDAAVFTNRCEGGTNLVAMECMACGVPTALSNNTGHGDLIAGDSCYVLDDQGPVPSPDGRTEGWGESSVDQVVETLERIYANRPEAARRGAAGAKLLATLTWRTQVDRLLAAIDGR